MQFLRPCKYSLTLLCQLHGNFNSYIFLKEFIEGAGTTKKQLYY